MNNITFDDLKKVFEEYNQDEIDYVRKAYEYAKELHGTQLRQSGEPYITHPLNVAYILAQMHADRDTVCAGLLHDTLEDTKATKKDLEHEFNLDIANLVDGVTKLSKMNFSSKKEENLANTRKIITGIIQDVRIIIIKLADRLHNMRTLQFKSIYKQKENSLETLEVFAPLAYYIGAYEIKNELEDLAFKYLNPEKYKELGDERRKIEFNTDSCLKEMLFKISEILNNNNIPNEIKIRVKNIYGIHKRLETGHSLSNIHDFLALKICVDEINNCYLGLGYVHSLYNPVPGRINDYIFNYKPNRYRSLHTTVFGPDNKIVQTQIRTFDMDKIATYGLTAYWDIEKGNARNVMQKDLKEKFQFYNSLLDSDSLFLSDEEFVNLVKSELLCCKNIYVYDEQGKIIEIPEGASVVDFAYKLGENIGDRMCGVLINNEVKPLNYVLKNNDRIKIKTSDDLVGPKKEWLEQANTILVRAKIKKKLSQ